MKLFEIIQSDIESQKEFIQRVANECQPFLNAKKPGQMLYRAFRQSQPDFIYNKIVRKDRRPAVTPSIFHKEMDKWFKKEFGYSFRSQSAFGNGNYDAVKLYGSIYIVYPVGQFKFLWSTETDDLTGSLGRKLRTKYGVKSLNDVVSNELKPNKEITDQVNAFIKDLPEFMDSLNYQSTNLSKALQSGNEVMILADSYHAMQIDSDLQGEMTDKMIYKAMRNESNETI